MQVQPASAPSTLGLVSGQNSAAAEGDAPFAQSLDEAARRTAARDVLGTLPPGVAFQILRPPADGSPPMAMVHHVFIAMQDGSYTPDEAALARPRSFVATLHRATQAFDSPDQMWETMRELLASARQAGGLPRAPRASDAELPAAAEAAPLIDTEAVAHAILADGESLPAYQVAWWTAALQFLLTLPAQTD